MRFYVLLLTLCLDTVTCSCSSSTTELTAEFDVSNDFESENYPYAYPAIQDCSWRITAASGSHSVLIYIDHFFLERNYDFLYVYDGNSTMDTLLWSGTGSQDGHFFISNSQNMYLRFTSDYSVQKTGFFIRYMSVDRTSSAASYSCYDTLTASSSPSQLSVVNKYDTDHTSACGYTITATVGKKIQFVIPIKDHGTLTVYNGTSDSDPVLVEYSGADDINTHESSNNSIYIVKPGLAEFVMVYQEVELSVTVPPTVTVPTTGAVVYACDTASEVATSTPQYIETPNYPGDYPNNAYCTVTITAADSTQSVQLTVLDFDLLYCCDFVKIFDGYDTSYTSLGIAWNVGDTVTSSGTSLHIIFSSDSSGNVRGAKAEYIQVSRSLPDCVPVNVTSLTATSSEQSFTSPNYPSYYSNYLSLYWLITKPTEDHSIVLNIKDIDIEHAVDCGYDKLTIYDGPCVTSPVLAEVCGTNDAVIEDNSGLYILVEFTTDYSVTDRGFALFYYLGEYTDQDEEGEIDLWFVAPVCIAAAAVFFTLVSICYARYKRLKASQRQINPGTTSGIKLAPSSGEKTPGFVPAPPRPKPPKRMTTSELLSELQNRYGSKENDKKSKVKRKHMGAYGAQQGTPGMSNVGGHPPPYSPPPYGGGAGDPAFPPNFFEVSANEAVQAPNATITPKSNLPPLTTPFVDMETNSIPPPAIYITPAEARLKAAN